MYAMPSSFFNSLDSCVVSRVSCRVPSHVQTTLYLKHKVANAPVELRAVVVLLAAQPQEVLRHARHDVAVDLHVYVALRRLQLTVPLLVGCVNVLVSQG